MSTPMRAAAVLLCVEAMASGYSLLSAGWLGAEHALRPELFTQRPGPHMVHCPTVHLAQGYKATD